MSLFLSASVFANTFDLPSGPAEKTLKQFSSQSGVELIFATDLVTGVTTNAVRGDLTPVEALQRMLRGTPLRLVKDEKPGAFAIKRDEGQAPNGPRAAQAGDRPSDRNNEMGSESGGRATGSMSGQVVDSTTQGNLAGVSVTIPSLGLSDLTDRFGRFRFESLPPGDYTLEATYVGRDPIRQTVAISAGNDTTVELDFGSEVVKLSKFVVESYREGWSKALQQKKTADNIGDVISADAVGNLPDRNVADAISRLPGVALIADSGEGQFVTIRGLNPNLNNITLNGATLASPGIRNLDGRDSVSGSVVPLDVIGSANIAQIEVTKTLTPEMDASAIGGTINLRTASAFDRKGRFLYGSAAGGYSSYARDQIYEGDITYGNRFGADQDIGLAVSANLSHRPFRTEAFQTAWNNAAFGDGRLVPFTLEILPEDAVRDRVGMTTSLDFRPTQTIQYHFDAVYNYFDEENTRHEAITRSNDVKGSFTGPMSALYSNTRAEHRVFRTETEQTQFNAAGGAKYLFGDFTLEVEGTYSKGAQSRPQMKDIQFRNSNIGSVPGFAIDYSGFIFNIDRGTSTFADPTKYKLQRYDESTVEVNEEIYTAKFDLAWTPKRLAESKFSVKTGGKYYRSDRRVDVNTLRYTGSFFLNGTGAARPGEDNLGKNSELQIDYDAAMAYVDAHRSALTLDVASSRSGSAAESFRVGEDIYAGYAMATATFNRLTLLGGVRVESTSASIRALEYRSIGGAIGEIYPNNADFDYTNVMPNIQARYEISKDLIVRAAFTSTIRRPEYEFAAPKATLQFSFSGAATGDIVDPEHYPNVGLLTIGNPDLKPYEALNYDLALEYYLRSGGILSAAVFDKVVSNPIYQTLDLQHNVIYNQLGFQDLQVSSFRNGSDGKIRGVELALQVPLKFMPDPFDGFGVEGNVSWVSSSVQIESRPGVKVKFFEQPDLVANAALYYQKGRLGLRLAYSYQDSSLRQIGTSAERDFYRADHYQTDAQGTFKLTNALSLFANVQNLTNQPQDTYMGNSTRLRFRRSYGWNARLGVKFRY